MHAFASRPMGDRFQRAPTPREVHGDHTTLPHPLKASALTLPRSSVINGDLVDSTQRKFFGWSSCPQLRSASWFPRRLATDPTPAYSFDKCTVHRRIQIYTGHFSIAKAGYELPYRVCVCLGMWRPSTQSMLQGIVPLLINQHCRPVRAVMRAAVRGSVLDRFVARQRPAAAAGSVHLLEAEQIVFWDILRALRPGGTARPLRNPCAEAVAM